MLPADHQQSAQRLRLTPIEPEEREDTPDWQVQEEEIPPSLRDKWERYQQKGVKAGICRSCGQLFTEEDLSCQACGEPIAARSGAVTGFFSSLFKTSWGLIFVCMLIAALATYLFLSF